jgi:hypothetical protein
MSSAIRCFGNVSSHPLLLNGPPFLGKRFCWFRNSYASAYCYNVTMEVPTPSTLQYKEMNNYVPISVRTWTIDTMPNTVVSVTLCVFGHVCKKSVATSSWNHHKSLFYCRFIWKPRQFWRDKESQTFLIPTLELGLLTSLCHISVSFTKFHVCKPW